MEIEKSSEKQTVKNVDSSPVCVSFFFFKTNAVDLTLGIKEMIYIGVNNYVLYFLFQDHPT